VVHSSDQGIQYACTEYNEVLQTNQMIPGMSRPANPYDNSTEGFMKTLRMMSVVASAATMSPVGRQARIVLVRDDIVHLAMILYFALFSACRCCRISS
jgi:transposase InsO family protein